MAQKLITSTDDPLYINAIVHLANLLDERTFGTPMGVSPKWQEKFVGKQYCEEGCMNGRCPGHTLVCNLGTITKHPTYKFFVFHREDYSNGKQQNVIYFYEDEDKAETQFNTLKRRARDV